MSREEYPVSPDLSCLTGRCVFSVGSLHAIHCHSYHNYKHISDLHMNWSYRMRTYYCQMLRPSKSS